MNPRNPKTPGPAPASVRDAIYARRAVRQYSPERVSDDRIESIIDAAVHAPSAMNSQPWAFVVVQRPALLRSISERAKAQLAGHVEPGLAPLDDPAYDIFHGATTLIVICAEKEGFGPAGDCYLAGENLMLAAHAAGLGSCPIGFALEALRKDELKWELGIPAEFVPVLPIVVGYPVGESTAVGRRPPRILNWIR
jgi:nitroreductase